MLPIRYINLDRGTERRLFMEEQAGRLGLLVERVRAVEPGDVDPLVLSGLKGSWERDLSGGEIGCFLSHRAEWERIAREGRPALILEDDAVLSRRLPRVLAALAAIEDADLVNLEDTGRRRFLEKGPGEEIAPGVRRVRCLRDKSGTGGYVLWPAAAVRLLQRSRSLAAPSDAFLHGERLRAFVCEPPLVIQAELLERFGATRRLAGGSTVQPAAGEARKPRARNWRQWSRRVATQSRLVPLQLRRLGQLDYRAVAADLADFADEGSTLQSRS